MFIKFDVITYELSFVSPPITNISVPYAIDPRLRRFFMRFLERDHLGDSSSSYFAMREENEPPSKWRPPIKKTAWFVDATEYW